MKSQTKEFLAEAEDILAAMDGDIMSLARGVNAGEIDHVVLNRIFRSVHTLKGLSSIFNFSDITVLSHALEDKLDMLRLGRLRLDDNCLRAIIMAHRLLSKIVNKRAFSGFSDEVRALVSTLQTETGPTVSSSLSPPEEQMLASLTEYEKFRLSDSLKAGKKLFIVSASFETGSFDKRHGAFIEVLGNVSEIIATLPSTGYDNGELAIDTLISTAKGAEEIEGRLCGFSGINLRELDGKVREVISCACAGLSPAARCVSSVESMRRNARTIRVDVDKIESLMSSVEELAGLKEAFRRLMDNMGQESDNAAVSGGIEPFVTRLEESFERMRECVLAVKMVRVGRLFKRFEPYIERLAHERGVEVCITTYGGDTELDMTIIEEIADPLMHIIRNVIDHAMESPSKRLACGKSRVGAITLSAYYEGEKVVVEVKDDGSGIDPELVCARAVSKRFINEIEARTMKRSEKLDLLFLPGFTTSDEISLTSGRGVGLDVVRENIALLNGLVEIETVSGKGTRFILTIPVTQVMKGLLMCEEGGKAFAIAGTRVDEVVELKAGTSMKDGLLSINDSLMRAIRPSELFHPNPADDVATCYAIVTSVGDERLCLVVDKVLREHNMIIRPLPFEHKISGILGLSEALDNEAVLVLDIAGILELLSSGDEDPPLRERIV